ncbi:sulfur globule protein CV3 family protein [Dictyocaulus viviparus]|uniref:Sulfur globule protein CV3 family protein n=1 Tax=Dictyocaulus viviparus TaxID=29172 RepID=A0A0D8XE65_DICVI|nr:sulfur globule protein CV3 family protein [Dictyocaulus viviparus]
MNQLSFCLLFSLLMVFSVLLTAHEMNANSLLNSMSKTVLRSKRQFGYYGWHRPWGPPWFRPWHHPWYRPWGGPYGGLWYGPWGGPPF